MLRGCWLVTLAACSFGSPNNGGADAPPADDASPMTADAPADTVPVMCFGSFVQVCITAAPGPAINIGSGATRIIDTQAGSLDCTATTPDVGACVVTAASFTVDGTIRAAGPRPLVLLASGSIVINGNGAIDVASHRGVAGTGAGANASRCQAGANPTMLTGGWGGSNGTKGGNGDRSGAAASGGDASAALSRPMALFGGCPGGKGTGASGNNVGAGGGAVDLIAAAIIVNGTINASGAGADGASALGFGGSGGGSGGLIVLDTTDVTINGSANVLAQGGGGGEGHSTNGSPGGDGTDPTTAGQAAAGGADGGSGGGDGGSGAATGAGGNGGDDGGGLTDGGGGGGGGAGFIITTDSSPPSPPTSKVCPAFS
jgi:hypothetical protein